MLFKVLIRLFQSFENFLCQFLVFGKRYFRLYRPVSFFLFWIPSVSAATSLNYFGGILIIFFSIRRKSMNEANELHTKK